MKTVLVGDIEGIPIEMSRLVGTTGQVIQLGDLGMEKEWEWFEEHMPSLRVVPGNHDSLHHVLYSRLSLGHFGLLSDAGIDTKDSVFFVRGAYSRDWETRIPGVNWWEYEELDFYQYEEAYKAYCRAKPKVVLSHDCPLSICHHIHGGRAQQTRTGTLLEDMFREHRPERWYFGHHHRRWEKEVKGTFFRCLDLAEHLEVDL